MRRAGEMHSRSHGSNEAQVQRGLDKPAPGWAVPIQTVFQKKPNNLALCVLSKKLKPPGERCGLDRLFDVFLYSIEMMTGHPAYVCAQLRKLLLYALVTPIYVVDTVDDRIIARHQARQREACGCA